MAGRLDLQVLVQLPLPSACVALGKCLALSEPPLTIGRNIGTASVYDIH